MRKDTIKRHIDRKILHGFSVGQTPDQLRVELIEQCNKFYDKIENRVDISNLEDIENISNARCRYLTLYIHVAKLRINELYKIETRDIYGWSNEKKFKALLFKEKITKN